MNARRKLVFIGAALALFSGAAAAQGYVTTPYGAAPGAIYSQPPAYYEPPVGYYDSVPQAYYDPAVGYYDSAPQPYYVAPPVSYYYPPTYYTRPPVYYRAPAFRDYGRWDRRDGRSARGHEMRGRDGHRR